MLNVALVLRGDYPLFKARNKSAVKGFAVLLMLQFMAYFQTNGAKSIGS